MSANDKSTIGVSSGKGSIYAGININSFLKVSA